MKAMSGCRQLLKRASRTTPMAISMGNGKPSRAQPEQSAARCSSASLDTQIVFATTAGRVPKYL